MNASEAIRKRSVVFVAKSCSVHWIFHVGTFVRVEWRLLPLSTRKKSENHLVQSSNSFYSWLRSWPTWRDSCASINRIVAKIQCLRYVVQNYLRYLINHGKKFAETINHKILRRHKRKMLRCLSSSGFSLKIKVGFHLPMSSSEIKMFQGNLKT